ncbi:MAG: cytochrome c family protein [Nitrospiraceae bacterium]|nr:cytochrome c family protein [Nitrospiraceae bacterium]
MRKRTRAAFLVILLLATVGLCAVASANSGYFHVNREFYPYYPSLVRWNKSHAPFTAPEVCKDCHPKQYEEWTGSLHALAFQDPLYQGELNKTYQFGGQQVARQCNGCHSPAGMVTGEIKGPGIADLSPLALAGVSCDICHSISGTTHLETPSHEPENGSFILSPGVDSGNGISLIKRGPWKPGKNCGGGFHECAVSPLHLSADLCAGCHQVYHYSDHFPLETTYLEWKHGAYAQKGILCQDCHMVDLKTFIKSADEYRKPLRSEYRHYFNGANYLVYYLAEQAAIKAGNMNKAAILKNKYEMAIKRLQLAADLSISPVYRGGKLEEIKVEVKNIRAGHNLPTSLTNVRQMWLELTALDDTGKILFTSGTLDARGHLPKNTRIFDSEGRGDQFHFFLNRWVVTSFTKNETIPPKGYKDVYYGINVPAGVKQVTIKARLRYRQADPVVAGDVLSAVPASINLEQTYGITNTPAMPVVDMVEKQAVFGSTRP